MLSGLTVTTVIFCSQLVSELTAVPRLSQGGLWLELLRPGRLAHLVFSVYSRMFRARLIPVVSSEPLMLLTVPTASNCSIATNATPMMTVVSIASISVKPLRRRAPLGGAVVKTPSRIKHDLYIASDIQFVGPCVQWE